MKQRLCALISLLQNPTFAALAHRQLAMKSISSNSWIIKTQEMLHHLELPTLQKLLECPPTKEHWKHLVNDVVSKHWKTKIETEAETKSTLKHMSRTFTPGKPHRTLDSCPSNPQEVKKSTKLE